jgi:proteasome lid subunit RPN8/RPN11
MPVLEAGPGVYRYELELLLGEGRQTHRLPLEKADFNRAIEAAFFEGLRQGVFRDYVPPTEGVRVVPRFPSSTDPHVAGFDVVLPTEGEGFRRSFRPDFFKGLARRVGVQLATAGDVPEEGVLVYQLNAFAEEPAPRRRGGLQIELESEPAAIPIRTGSRRALGTTEAWDTPTPEDFPVLVPRHVIEESVEEARRHPEREVGGALLGHLRRDGESNELYLEVSCLVPGEETQATEVSVTFTHATWARVREVVEWRGEGELIVGWVHSHPFRLCAECPLPVPLECQRKVLFYSTDDEFLMELSFARPFMVGLLAAVEPRLEGVLGHAPVKLYGWRNGLIESRGFEVMDG